MYKKGQAAMEYLMTYGWAILVIVIVLALLAFYLPSLIKSPENCLFSQPGFSCNEKKHALVADSANDVALGFSLSNKQSESISVVGVLCTTDSVGNLDKTQMDTSVATTIASGASKTFTTDCLKTEGSTTTQVNMKANSDFKGTLAIWYKFSSDLSTTPDRLASASLTGTVLTN